MNFLKMLFIHLRFKAMFYFILAYVLACMPGWFMVFNDGAIHKLTKPENKRAEEQTPIPSKESASPALKKESVNASESASQTKANTQEISVSLQLGNDANANSTLKIKTRDVNDYTPMEIFLMGGGSIYANIHLSILPLILLCFYLYIRPILKVLIAGRDSIAPPLVQKAQIRLLNIARDSFILAWVVAFLYTFNEWWFLYSNLSYTHPYFTVWVVNNLSFGFVFSSCLLAWLDPHSILFIKDVFSEAEIYAPKSQGASIGIGTKILFLVMSACVIPMMLLFYVNIVSSPTMAELFNAVILKKEGAEFVRLLPNMLTMLVTILIIAYALFIAVTSGSNLRRSISAPIEMLIQRMEDVQNGNYDNKTTVYTNDEIGRLKANFNKMLDGLKQREFIKDTFGRFMSVEISKQILEQGQINLGGEELTATVLFSDIRDFTSISETMSATSLVALLNQYFEVVVQPILKEQGVVNKYVGDCVMALFGVPNKSDDHAERALRAALAMREALAEFNQIRLSQGLIPLKSGIGIHTGRLVAGNVGAKARIEYTVIGDTVNIASRIESKTKDLGTDILVSESVLNALKPEYKALLKTEYCHGVKLKGKASDLTLVKIL